MSRTAFLSDGRRRRILGIASPAIVLAISIAAPLVANAATRVWTGGTGGAFNTSANWGTGGVPGANDIASFSGSTNPCTITASTTVGGIIISAGTTVTQAPGVTQVTVTGDFNQSAGTFNGGNGNLLISGDLILSVGTFNASSGLTQIGGAFTMTSGTFNHNLGRVLLTSTASKTLATNATTFNDLYINDGMLAYWPFEDTASPSLDSSGWARAVFWGNGTNDNTAHATTNFTNSRSLGFAAATSDYAIFSSPAATSTTITAWVYSISRPNTFPRIIGTPAWQLAFSDNTGVAPQVNNALAWTIIPTSGAQYSWRTGAGTISDGAWYHIAVTYDGASTATAYINGANSPVTQLNTPTAGPISNVGTGYIGNSAAGDFDWNGYIDDMRIYNRVLSAAEIADIYSGSQRTTPVGTQTLSGTLKAQSNLVIASGTLDVSAAGCGGAVCDIQVGGSWLNLGGAFTPRTGTVTFNGTGSTNVIRSDRVPFNNLTISNTGSWTLDDRLVVDNALAISAAGTLDQSSSNFDIHAGTLTKTAGTLTGAGDVVLDATTAQTLTVNSLSPALRIESPLDNGLVGYWKLDEGRGTTAYNVTGNGYNGTLYSSASWSSSVPTSPAIPIDDAGSLYLNGSGQYVRVSRNAAFETAAVTVSAWIKRNGSQTQSAKVLDKTINNSAATPWQSYSFQMNGSGSDPGLVSFETGYTDNNVHSLNSAANAVADGTWTHVVGVYEPSGTAPQKRLYINGVLQNSTTETRALKYDATSSGDLYLGQHGGSSQWFKGNIDDVRIYNRGLSANEVAALYSSGYSTGSTVVYSLGGTATMGSTLKLDSGILDAASFSNAITGATTVNGGQYIIGSNSSGQTFTGGLSVNRYGTLTLASNGGKAIMGSASTFNMDGTLAASNTGASIQGTGTAYNFRVGSVSGATPTLNITGLQVKNTSANGMYINYNTGATTTFTRFDNIAFSNGPGTGTGNYNLRIYATSLNLASNGCSFDASVSATVEKNVFLAGNGTGDGETRALFGGATCASGTTCEAYDGDDDNNATPDGVGDNSGNAAVVQWIASAQADTSGSIEGFPTAAFSWTSFTYYATYVAYHDTNGTSNDTVFVRNGSGTAQYSWSTAENIIGTPRWDTVGGVHYVYVATTGGKVYRLIDSGSSLSPDTNSPWDGASNNPFNCNCTITTPLAQDTNFLYWGGIATTDKLWTLGKTSVSPRMPSGSPLATTATTSNTAPAIWTSGNTFTFLGLMGRISKVNTSTQALSGDNVNPGVSNAVTGRITIIANKLYAGDDNGYLWSLDPDTNFDANSGTYKFWGYHDGTNHAACGGVCQIKSHYFDPATSRACFGDQDGHIYTVNSSGAQVLAPWRPGPSMAPFDAFATAPLYQGGVIVAGTTGGTLYIIDGNSNGTVPAKIQTYKFASSTAVSGVGYDTTTGRYMISTANTGSKDGRLYYIAAVTDPTTGFP